MAAGCVMTLALCLLPTVLSLGNDNIDFLVEGEYFRYTPQVKVARLNLHINIDFDLTSAVALKTDMLALLAKWGKYPPFKLDPTLEDSYFKLTKPSIEKMSNWLITMSQILAYTTPLPLPPEVAGQCNYTVKGLPKVITNYGLQAIKDAWAHVDTTWTAEVIKKDHTKDSTIRNFIQTLSTEVTEWDQVASTTLSLIDELASGSFPKSLMGHYQNADCLNHSIGEDIKVIGCQGYSSSYSCVIEVRQPEVIKTVLQLIPVHYGTIRLSGHTKEDIFIKDSLQSEISLLSCQDDAMNTQDVKCCTPKPWPGECIDSLMKGEMRPILNACNWTRDEYVPVGTFLLDGSLLVQGDCRKIQVKSGTTYSTVATETPVRVFSGTEILVKRGQEMYKYPGKPDMTGVTVVTSKIPKKSWVYLESTIYWREFWQKIGLGDYIDASLIFLQLVFMPIGIVALKKGVKASNAMQKEIATRKYLMKRNYKSNSKLIKSEPRTAKNT
jgi:hypothetical protein